ncbi:MAG: GPW/gp25 family protein [candidate division KSB1 bacterium]|nr:GPW/gp25 family protein [candidate division KSB1 bacterium]MDZ7273982.1 GPW/gp25 family protein [candidate division KSB1 bacterium]MDZ7286355.1 GPW/gp25 family protein [candidate division KSB1 bacterium]MDZ7296583.1 GPW/gp25 family protein [candidate division KSB1 bacterium]MDZ7306116.1 GPW/gp25 family protein [candidate division KSB1 bacterium]
MNGLQPDPAKAFLGVGWAFPPKLEADGTIAEAVYEEDIRQAIRIILGTNPGERVMRPDFGAGLNAFVFEPVNTTTMALIKTRVAEALIDWEPRIDVEEVKVTSDAAQRHKLLIDVHYRVRATNVRHNLVYPFYLEEGAAA